MHYDWAISLPGGPSDVDSSDDILHFMYDAGWRLVATFREDDADPKEYYTYHAPGIGGRVGGDRFILRDKDADTDWTAASDGTLEERIYYVQNWRGDVVNLLTDAGAQVESVRYSAYGVPFGMPAGDTDLDGDVNDGINTDDTDQIQTWISGPTYDVRGDLDLDGDVDAADKTAALSTAGVVLGRNVQSQSALAGVSSSASGNRFGYAGYVWDETTTLDHVRYRVYDSAQGNWMRRDPAGFIDGPNFYEYSGSNAAARVDPSGLSWGDSGTVDCHHGLPCGGHGSTHPDYYRPFPGEYDKWPTQAPSAPLPPPIQRPVKTPCNDKHQSPGHSPNGCGSKSWQKAIIPEGYWGLTDFTPCCDAHDLCYVACEGPPKVQCDLTFIYA